MTRERWADIQPVQPYGDIVNKLSRTLAAANRYLVHLMKAEGIEGLVPSHGDVLRQLFLHESLSMAALADLIGKDPSTVTALVKKMVDAGYVETFKSPEDRRVIEVRLTEEGRKLDQSVKRINDELMKTAAEGLSDQQMREAYGVLEAMQANFNQGREEI